MQSSRAITRVAIAGLVALALLGAAEKPAPPQLSTMRKLGAALIHACDVNDDAEALRLLDAGADPNAEDKDGETPLFYSASNNNVEMIRLLVSRGADANHARRTGDSALTYAAIGGRDQAVSALIDAGAEVDHKEQNGWTPLMVAVINGHLSTADTLLQKHDVTPLLSGADVNARDNSGKTPLILALIEFSIAVDTSVAKPSTKASHPRQPPDGGTRSTPSNHRGPLGQGS